MGCASTRANSDRRSQQDLPNLLHQIKKQTSQIGKKIHSRQSPESVVEDLSHLRSLYEELSQMTPSKGNPALLRQYCEVSQGILADVQSQVRRSYWPAAKKSFERLNDLRKDIALDFAPSFMDRLALHLRRIFSRHPPILKKSS